MKILEFIGRQRIIAILLGAAFLIYNFLAVELGIYFFWESAAIGMPLVIVPLSGLLFAETAILIKFAKKDYRPILRKVFTVLFALIILAINTVTAFSESTTTAKIFIKQDERIQKAVGGIESFGWLPLTSSLSSSSGSEGSYDYAYFHLIVKGKTKFRIISIEMERTNKGSWDYNLSWVE